MKNLTKLFVAVVALFACACTTDATTDEAIQLGNGNGVTELTLSLDYATKTQLTDKVGDLYPLVWSEGDQISVNGIASSALTAQQAGKDSATFSFGGVLATPYQIAYPAANEGEVLFASQQTHTANTTFGNGVATMYGYSENGADITLNHLTGVLKIGVTGDGEILTQAQISTIDRAPIAGAFDINFATGELEATESSKAVINYSFGEGVTLSSTPTYLHIAVPAGIYDELYVTLYDKAGGVMYATVKADESKPLNAGKVREFKNAIPYLATEHLFVISDVASLKDFGAKASTLNKDAVLVNDIDMTGENWTSIPEGFTNTLIGNGYSIKGLNAPLFAYTTGSIRGLHLVDVDINSTTTLVLGAFAGSFRSWATATEKSVIENCSASGTIVLENTTTQPSDNHYLVNVAGIAGNNYGAKIVSCVSNVDITIKQISAPGNTKAVKPHLGGIIGYTSSLAGDNGTFFSEVSDCVNHGKLTYLDRSCPDDGLSQVFVGGIAAKCYDSNTGFVLDNNTNYADIEFNAVSQAACVGGILGMAKGDTTSASIVWNDNTNHGNIKVSGVIDNYLYAGGVAGYSTLYSIDGAYNNGKLDITSNLSVLELQIGGVIGYNAGSDKKTHNIKNIKNTGAVNVYSSAPEGKSDLLRIGGLIGYSQASITNAVNEASGKITIAGTLHTNGERITSATSRGSNGLAIGGIAGYKTLGSIVNGTNHADIVYSGAEKVIASGDWKDMLTQNRIGGITGYISSNPTNIVCDGKIILSGKFEGEFHVGGLIGFTYAENTTKTNHNDCDIEISGEFAGGLSCGGCIGYACDNTAEKKGTISNYTNKGTITVTKDAVIGGPICNIAGVVGTTHGWGTVGGSVTSCSNEGVVTVEGTVSEALCYTAGVVGHSTMADNCKAHTLSNLTNSGSITLGANIEKANSYIAGICCRTANTISSCTNNGTINFSGAAMGGNLYVAGVVSFIEPNLAISGLVNNGTVTSTDGCNASNSFRMSGVIGYAKDTSIDDCHNHGNVSINGTIENVKTVHAAGLSYQTTDVSNCSNTGKISLNCSMPNGNARDDNFLSALVCRPVDGAVSDCVNGDEKDRTKGCLELSANAAISGKLRVSLFPHTISGDATNITNYGDIKALGSTGYTLYLGSLSTYGPQNNKKFENVVNYGNITVSGRIGDPAIKGYNNGADCFIGGLVDTTVGSTTTTYKNCHNHGDITVTSRVANSTRVAGIVARVESSSGKITLDSCSNTGNIIYNGSVSEDTAGASTAGGIVAGQNAGSITVVGSLVNRGNITSAVSQLANGNDVMIGGIFGSAKTFTFTNCTYLQNTGNVSYSGTANKGVRLGGIIGSSVTTSAFTVPMINSGNISYTGTCGSEFASHVGGCVGYLEAGISNAQSVCSINAYTATGAGLITGVSRSETIVASNCQIGGKICSKLTVKFDEENDTDVAVTETLNTSNFYKYIYGAPINTDTASADNCSLISEVVLPEAPTTEPTE